MTGALPELKLGTYRDIWAGPITELNPPLKFLKPTQHLELSPEDARASASPPATRSASPRATVASRPPP